MGLDMYVTRVNKGDVSDNDQVDVNLKEIESSEFQYWRKFNAVHNWMEKLYCRKGGTKTSFNCTNVRLTKEDLICLEADIENLAPTSGSLWGSTEPLDNDDKEDVRKFCRNALSEIVDGGGAIFYDSWW